jgi:peptidoglycan/xylan/chitin deacetylase (PgdA/CDA1 family)
MGHGADPPPAIFGVRLDSAVRQVKTRPALHCPGPAGYAAARMSANLRIPDWLAGGRLCLAAAMCLAGCARGPMGSALEIQRNPRWTLDQGGIVRGDVNAKEIALILTGGEYGEGTGHILDVLQQANVKASFFVTGAYLGKSELQPYLRRMVAEGHYLGPHSDSHPLYCPWEDRSRTLVTEDFFRNDLRKNIADLKRFGALRQSAPIYFIPPSEWYNQDQVRWAMDMGIVLFNFTPGSGSNRDWAPEGHRSFVPSEAILQGILDYERKDAHGLNGFLLLLHLGSQRQDKMHPHVGPLIDELRRRGYRFVRVDELLKT